MNGDWLIRGRDGRLTVYLPSGDAVLCRAERGPAGPWEDVPRTVGGSQKLHPGAAVGQGRDGYAHLAAWRPTVPGESGLVHSTHFRPGLAPLDWVPIGHPDQKGDRTGPPAVAVDGAGRGYVFVRNTDGGVSLRNQKVKGGWSSWQNLEGHDVEGELAAVTGESGLVELYASVPGGILHWRQEGDGKRPVRAEGVDVPVRLGTLRALATSAEHTTLFFTDSSGDLCAWRPGEKPATLLTSAGPGPVSAVRCEIEGHDCTVLAQRSASGRVAFAAYPTEQESAGAWWTGSGPQLPADAVVSVALDEHGEVVAASVSPSTGTVLLTRRKDEPGLALEAWREI
ncbi:hypothetical protein ACFY9S_17675 [Streptomyces sp. NPDC012474]|uniref:hypothetical protein n=1 Tax=Streptomyces sp. NPDC012474 TaxID=3364836 RepID=UPI0036E48203